MLPVLLVHGIDDTAARMKHIQRALLAAGFPHVRAMQISPPDGSIPLEAMGAQVRQEAAQLLSASGAAQVDVVAYSMGALATRYFIQRLGGQALVRRYISLAAPHHGTYLAYLRPNAGARQMRPGSALLQALNADRASWGQVEVYSFWSPFDLMVRPARSAQLEWAHDRRFNVLLHPWMSSDRRVIRAVVESLGDEK